jgi:hypothetical protein
VRADLPPCKKYFELEKIPVRALETGEVPLGSSQRHNEIETP